MLKKSDRMRHFDGVKDTLGAFRIEHAFVGGLNKYLSVWGARLAPPQNGASRYTDAVPQDLNVSILRFNSMFMMTF